MHLLKEKKFILGGYNCHRFPCRQDFNKFYLCYVLSIKCPITGTFISQNYAFSSLELHLKSISMKTLLRLKLRDFKHHSDSVLETFKKYEKTKNSL